MKRSEIYREAARRIEAGSTGCNQPTCYYSCCALAVLTAPEDGCLNGMRTGWSHYDAVRIPYAALFVESDWWNVRAHSDERILALCFMAAIAEDEEQ